MKRDITTKNNKNKHHGYQESYNWLDKLCYRGNYNNGKVIAYHEYHGSIKTFFYIK